VAKTIYVLRPIPHTSGQRIVLPRELWEHYPSPLAARKAAATWVATTGTTLRVLAMREVGTLGPQAPAIVWTPSK